MSDIRSARNFAHLSRDVPMFSSLEEVHEKLSELLGNFFLLYCQLAFSFGFDNFHLIATGIYFVKYYRCENYFV